MLDAIQQAVVVVENVSVDSCVITTALHVARVCVCVCCGASVAIVLFCGVVKLKPACVVL